MVIRLIRQIFIIAGLLIILTTNAYASFLDLRNFSDDEPEDDLVELSEALPHLPYDEILLLRRHVDGRENLVDNALAKYFRHTLNETVVPTAILKVKQSKQLCEVMGEFAQVSLQRRLRHHINLSEENIKSMADNPEVRKLVSAAGRLRFIMNNHYFFDYDLASIEDSHRYSQGPLFPLYCYECHSLQVKSPTKKQVFKVRARLSGYSEDGKIKLRSVEFRGKFTPGTDLEMALASDYHLLSIRFDARLTQFLTNRIDFKKVLAYLLRHTESCRNWFGYALITDDNFQLNPLFFAGGISDLADYCPKIDARDFQPLVESKKVMQLTKFLSGRLQSVTYNSDEWKRSIQGVGLYKQLVVSQDPLQPGLLRSLFPPLPVVEKLIECHAAYGDEYEKHLLCFFRNRTVIHDENCIPSKRQRTRDEFFESLNNLFRFTDLNRKDDHPFDSTLATNVLSLLQIKTNDDPLTAWRHTFGFDVRWIQALTFLRTFGFLYRLIAPELNDKKFYDAYDKRYYDVHIPELIKEVYLKVVPLTLPQGIDESLRNPLIDRALHLVQVRRVNTIHDAVSELTQGIGAIERNLMDFPSLPQESMRTQAQGYLFTGSSSIDTFFQRELRTLCLQRCYMPPELVDREDQSGVSTSCDISDDYIQRLLDRQFKNRGSYLETVEAEFRQHLQATYQEIMGRGWLKPGDCQQYIYETEISGVSPWLSLGSILEKNPSNVDDFIAQQFPFTEAVFRENRKKEFCFGMARLLLSPGEILTVEQAYEQHFPVWVRRCFELIPVLLSDQMKDRVTDKVLKGQNMAAAVAEEVPSLYEAILGPLMVLKNQDICMHTAHALLNGRSFLDCHGLKKNLISKQAWFQAIIELKEIPLSDYDLAHPKGAIFPPFEDLMTTFAASLSQTKESEIWKMSPFEVICKFRQVNGLISTTSYVHAIELDVKMTSRREEAKKRQQAQVDARIALNQQRRFRNNWHLDGRNVSFHNAAVLKLGSYIRPMTKTERMTDYTTYGPDNNGITFSLKVNQLVTDPFLKKPQLELDVPNDVSDETFQQMQDVLCCLTRDRILTMRAALHPIDPFSQDDIETAREACCKIKQFFRMALLNVEDYKDDNPVIPDQHYRKRIARIYDRLFRPLIDKEDYDQSYRELEVIMTYANDCIDGARLCLLMLEQHPQVMALEQAPDLFERLACVLRDFRLSIIADIARDHAKYSNFKDPVGFDLIMRNVFNIALSLGLEDSDQHYLSYMNYTDVALKSDVHTFITKYRQGLLRAVIQAVQYRSMPTGDKDPHNLFMKEISDWAENSTYYCNSVELDKDLMDGPTIRPQAVANLLEAAGYIEHIDGRFF